MAVPGSSGAVLTRTDLTFKVGEEEAGGGEGGVGEVVVGVVPALGQPPASLPTLHLLVDVWQELQQVICPDVAFDDGAAAKSTRPGGVLADAVDALEGGGAGGEEDAGVDQLKLGRTKVGDVGATILLSTMLSTLVDGQN